MNFYQNEFNTKALNMQIRNFIFRFYDFILYVAQTIFFSFFFSNNNKNKGAVLNINTFKVFI